MFTRRSWFLKGTGVGLAALGLFAMSVESRDAGKPESTELESKPAAVAASTEREEVEMVDVTPFGFEPSRVSRPHGQFVLAVHNHSGESQLSLRLDRVQGERLHEVRMDRVRRIWDQPLNLPPGDYILLETNHPGWQCRITISN